MLLLVFKRDIIKLAAGNSALDEVFKPLILDLEFLKTIGIKLNNGVRLLVKLAQSTGDNHSTNEMMKIPRNFSIKDCCKFCLLFYHDLQDSLWLDGCVCSRSMPLDHLFNKVISNPYLYCPDPFHDFFECGIVSKLINPLLNIYYANDLTDLTERINQTNFKNGPIYISRKNGKLEIGGKGSQIQEFFYKFAQLDTKILRSSDHWKCYLILRSIVIFFTSISKRRESIEQSRQMVYDFLSLYYKLFVDTKIETGTFKLHHLIHYPALELIFGPLFYLATWRYERFHQRMMQLVSQSKNMTNLEFSMAKAFAQTFKLNLNKDEIKFSNAKPSLSELQTFRRFSSFVDLNRDFKVVKEATIQKIQFKSGLVFVYKDLGTIHPLFCKIEIIFHQDDKLIVICKLIQTVRYCMKQASYCVKLTENLATIDPFNLEYYKSLDFNEDAFLISKDFHLLNENILDFH